MLSIQATSRSNEKVTPHIVPFRIGHTGAADLSTKYWNPQPATDEALKTGDAPVVYFRGRRLIGRNVPLKEGYRGAVVEMTDKTVDHQFERSGHEDSMPSNTAEQCASAADEASDDGAADADDEPEKAQVMEEIASFDSVMIWGHDSMPTEDEPAVRGLQEWFGLAEAIHGYESSEPPR